MSGEADEQRQIDLKRSAQAQDIVDSLELDPGSTHAEAIVSLSRAKACARAWIVTSLQQADNEAYMREGRDAARGERDRLRVELDDTLMVLRRLTRDNVQLMKNLTDTQERASSLMMELQAERAASRMVAKVREP